VVVSDQSSAARVMVLDEHRLKLTGVAAIEAIEVVETEAGPVVKRTTRWSTAGVLWFLPIQAVAYPFCFRISATVPALLGMIPV